MFFVFLFAVGVLTTQFLPVLTKVNTPALPTSGAFSSLGAIPIMTINRFLFHACLVQALFSGLIAGQMGESSIAAGVKHSCVLLVIALIAFKFVLVI